MGAILLDFICDMTSELPFVLNLPDGIYSVDLNGDSYDLEVLQNQYALHIGERNFAVGSLPDLRDGFGESFESGHKQALRTLIRHRWKITAEESELPTPTDEQMREEIGAATIGEDPLRFADDKPGLDVEIQRRFAALSGDALQQFRSRLAKKLHTRKVPDKDRFIEAINTLVRLYMDRFNDFFVEEVAIHQLSSQSPLTGVYRKVVCDGELIHHSGIVGKVPPLMRRQWLNHPTAQVESFQRSLSQGDSPDSVSLLGIRARAFLERGAYRSAIIEASAAMDLAVAKKIREGLSLQGQSSQAIDDMLRQPYNQRFADRAKKILKTATGKSAAAMDNALWQRVSVARTTHRQGVAHADREPPRQDSEQVVNDFLAMAALVSGIIPDCEIASRAYRKWQESGKHHGDDVQHWLDAEQELIAERTTS